MTAWIIVAVLIWAVVLVLVGVLLAQSKQQDHAARRQEKLLYPESDVTVTTIRLPDTTKGEMR